MGDITRLATNLQKHSDRGVKVNPVIAILLSRSPVYRTTMLRRELTYSPALRLGLERGARRERGQLLDPIFELVDLAAQLLGFGVIAQG